MTFRSDIDILGVTRDTFCETLIKNVIESISR